MEHMPSSESPKKRNGYDYTESEIRSFESLKEGTIVEFVRDGHVLSGIIDKINSINDIQVGTGETNETYSYGVTTTLGFEDITYIDNK